MRVAKRYVISGRVQGVGFRYFVQSAAVREGVEGWARNLPDGRVEISAAAEQAVIERFEREIRRGPRSAIIDDVEVFDAPIERIGSGFSIR